MSRIQIYLPPFLPEISTWSYQNCSYGKIGLLSPLAVGVCVIRHLLQASHASLRAHLSRNILKVHPCREVQSTSRTQGYILLYTILSSGQRGWKAFPFIKWCYGNNTPPNYAAEPSELDSESSEFLFKTPNDLYHRLCTIGPEETLKRLQPPTTKIFQATHPTNSQWLSIPTAHDRTSNSQTLPI